MGRIWEFAPWLPYEIPIKTLMGSCRFSNGSEVFANHLSPGVRYGSFTPIPDLVLTLDDFDIDCFALDSSILISKKMREAMSLAQDDIQYFSISSGKSSRSVQSMDYMIMHVVPMSSVTTPADSGSAFDYDENSIDVFADTENRIFREKKYRGSIFCQDNVASAALEVGCTGVRFFDPRYRSLNQPMRFRTIRGVEAEGDWDPVNKIEHTELVEKLSRSDAN